jgi:hypothetical protein
MQVQAGLQVWLSQRHRSALLRCNRTLPSQWISDAVSLSGSAPTDPEGEGAVVPMVSSTVALVRKFLADSGIEEGALFRRVMGQRPILWHSGQRVAELEAAAQDA